MGGEILIFKARILFKLLSPLGFESSREFADDLIVRREAIILCRGRGKK